MKMKAGGLGNLLFCRGRKWGEKGMVRRPADQKIVSIKGDNKRVREMITAILSCLIILHPLLLPCYLPSPCSNLQWPRIHKSPGIAQDGHKHPHVCRYDPDVENTGGELWGVCSMLLKGPLSNLVHLALAELLHITTMPHIPICALLPQLLKNGLSLIYLIREQ